MDRLLDHINDLNDLTPKIRAEGRNGVDPSVIFGLDSKLFLEKEAVYADASHHDEVETATVYIGPQGDFGHKHVDHACDASCNDHNDVTAQEHAHEQRTHIAEEVLTAALATLPKESIWRVKGFIRTENGPRILNWAFQRFELTPIESSTALAAGELLKLTVMGERGEAKRIARRQLAGALGATVH